jgi:hypothetical protein
MEVVTAMSAGVSRRRLMFDVKQQERIASSLAVGAFPQSRKNKM